MSEEQTVATETVSEETTQEAPTNSPEGALIAESKKYRKRAQEVESENSRLKAVIEAQKEAEMLADGKKDELIAKYKANSEADAKDANWAREFKANERAKLLELHPEEDREKLAELPFDTLSFITNKINHAKANPPEVAGTARVKDVPKDWTKMDMADLKENWEDILKSAEAKMKR